MSFFDDFVNSFNISDASNELMISCVLGRGVMVVGKAQVEDFGETEVVVRYQKKCLKIVGLDLKIKSMARGEVCVVGNVKSIISGAENEGSNKS